MLYKNYLTLIPLLFFTACIEQKATTPTQKKEIHIIKLNKEVKELDSHDKRLIYKSIKNEIRLYNKKGNEDYHNGYYYDATKAYKLVNFYEGYRAISQQKIDNIQALAKKRAAFYYREAQKYLHTDKKKACIALNHVMMNNPEYKNAKKLYTALKNERTMTIYINTLENSLETKLVNYKGSFQELKAIQKSLNALAQYDYKNKSLQKARTLLREQKKILLNKAIAIYKKGEWQKSKHKFLEILSLYPEDTSAQHYIKRIAFKQSKKHNLTMAKSELNKKSYLTSIAYAKKVLELEPYNAEAKQIIASANKKAKARVKQLVQEGKRYYNSKNLDLAQHCFKEALQIDKTNNTSLIYYKKIQRQLQTIQSLQ